MKDAIIYAVTTGALALFVYASIDDAEVQPISPSEVHTIDHRLASRVNKEIAATWDGERAVVFVAEEDWARGAQHVEHTYRRAGWSVTAYSSPPRWVFKMNSKGCN